MMPGADQIIACPKCAGLAKYMTLASGNTFGLRMWTDCKRIAPMLPQPPDVVKCRNCAEFYWLSEAEEIGTFNDPYDEGDEVVAPPGSMLNISRNQQRMSTIRPLKEVSQSIQSRRRICGS